MNSLSNHTIIIYQPIILFVLSEDATNNYLKFFFLNFLPTLFNKARK